MDSWQQYDRYLLRYPDLGVFLDISQMGIPDDFLGRHEAACQHALAYMGELEAGAVKNVDEDRMVGHYWLRDPVRAPELKSEGRSLSDYVEGCWEDWPDEIPLEEPSW